MGQPVQCRKYAHWGKKAQERASEPCTRTPQQQGSTKLGHCAITAERHTGGCIIEHGWTWTAAGFYFSVSPASCLHLIGQTPGYAAIAHIVLHLPNGENPKNIRPQLPHCRDLITVIDYTRFGIKPGITQVMQSPFSSFD